MPRAKRRRQRGSGGIRKQDGKFYPYFVTTDVSGEKTTHRPGRSFPSADEAQGWISATEQKLRRCRSKTGATAYDAVREFLEARPKMDRPIKGSTLFRYGQTLAKAAPHLKKLAMQDCSPAALETFIGNLPFSAAEREKVFGLLNQTFARLCRLELLDRNPLASLLKPTPVRKKARPYTKEQSHKLIETIAGDRYESLYLVLLTTGLRPGEAFALDWDDVDFEREAINVTRTLADYGGSLYLSETTKTTSGERWLKLARITWEAMERHAANGNRSGLVWKSPRGAMLRKSNWYRRHWNPLLLRAGLPRREPYTLRHSFATLGLLNGIPLRAMSQMLGHSSPEITMKVYAHVFDDTQAQQVHKIDAIFAANLGLSVSDSVSDAVADSPERHTA